MCKKLDFYNVVVHCFTDGRDVSPTSAKNDLQKLLDDIKEIGVGKIASVCGRYYAMDRDKRWDRVEKAYNCITNGVGNKNNDPVEYLQDSYDKNITDEFIEPCAIVDENDNITKVENGDSFIFFNFRPDRARQLTRAFVDDDFDGFKRTKYKGISFVTMTEYDKTIKNVQIAYPKQGYNNVLGHIISENGLKQLRIAETEKYAHVTFFFNGGVEEPNKGEDRILVKSPKVATYDLKPEMSAYEVCDKLVDAIKSDKYDVIIINFANPDMVGHTGVEDAAIKAIEAVDECVGKAVDALKEVDGQMFICADHGNAEQLIDETTGEPFTAHTTNPVPFILVNADPAYKLREGGCLADIAPTLIELMGMEQPKEMTGKSLLVK